MKVYVPDCFRFKANVDNIGFAAETSFACVGKNAGKPIGVLEDVIAWIEVNFSRKKRWHGEFWNERMGDYFEDVEKNSSLALMSSLQKLTHRNNLNVYAVYVYPDEVYFRFCDYEKQLPEDSEYYDKYLN